MKRSGFSIIEVVVTIGVLSIMTGLSVPVFRTYQIRNDLNLATEQSTQGLARAKLLSQTRERDSEWGFFVPTGTLYKGVSYEARDTNFDEVYPMPSTITTSGSILEVSFGKGDGLPSQTGSIVLTALDGEYRTIVVEIAVRQESVATNESDSLVICHKPSSGASQTKTIPDNAWPGHQAHGDTLGACAASSVGNNVDIAIAKTGPTSAVYGTNVAFTLKAGNNGPNTALNVNVGETMNAQMKGVGYSFVSSASPFCTKAAGSDVINCTVGNVPMGSTGSAIITYSVPVPAGACSPMTVYNATAGGGVTAPQNDTNPANNYSGTVNTGFQCPPSSSSSSSSSSRRSSSSSSSSSSVYNPPSTPGQTACNQKFEIDNDRTIDFLADNKTVRLTVLGSELKYGNGGPWVDVYLYYRKRNSGNWTKLFNERDINEGDVANMSNFDSNDILSVRFRGYYRQNGHLGFDQSYYTNDGTGHAILLGRGDELPNYPVFQNQASIPEIVAEYLDENDRIDIDPCEVLVLTEIGSLSNQSTVDFQDAVFMLKIQ